MLFIICYVLVIFVGGIWTENNFRIFIYKDKTMSKEMRKQIDRVKNWKQFLNESNDKSKELKWFNRLKTHEREFLSKKYPMNDDFNSFEDWVVYVYKIKKSK